MSGDTLFIKRNRQVNKVVTANYIRPSDTVTYAVGDVMCNSTSSPTVLTFSDIARMAGGGFLIQNAILISNVAQTLKIDARLWLFDTAPAMQNDNVAWAPSDAEMELCFGFIDFATGNWKTAGANGVIQASAVSLAAACSAAVKNVYGVLVAGNAYVPVSAEKWVIRLGVMPD